MKTPVQNNAETGNRISCFRVLEDKEQIRDYIKFIGVFDSDLEEKNINATFFKIN